MASVLRLIPRFGRISSALGRYSAPIASRTLMTPVVTKAPTAQQRNQLLVAKPQFLKPEVRLMSTDPDCEEEIRERVMTVLCLFDKINPDLLTLGSHFMRDLGLDSLDHVEIIIAIENDFAFEISDSQAELLLTPQEIIEFICDEFDVEE